MANEALVKLVRIPGQSEKVFGLGVKSVLIGVGQLAHVPVGGRTIDRMHFWCRALDHVLIRQIPKPIVIVTLSPLRASGYFRDIATSIHHIK